MSFKERKYRYYLPVVFALILLIGMWAGIKLAPESDMHGSVFAPAGVRYNKVSDLMNYIINDYVDSVSKEQLSEDAILGILENLDPHSQYIPAEALAEVTEQLMGNFEGIGIQFRIESDTITVIQTIDGGPSEKVGLLAGDRIVMVDDSLVAGVGVNNKDAIGMLKGPRGTNVDVKIYRRGIIGLMDFSIIRDVIPTFSVDVSYMPEDTIGYIKVSKFSATTYEEFVIALRSLLDQGMTSLILDLRGNTGGYLQAATKITDEFLKENELIVYTEGNNRPRNFFYATRKGFFEEPSLIVLINEGSASASEIIAGAVQDNDRGMIIGRRSFGKGLVQEQLNLPDGSAVRLTIARYYTPTGRCIQRSYENGTEGYYHDFYERFHNGEMQNADSVHFDDSLKYVTPGGRIVYGGGGIMPDIYVSYNSSDYPEYYNTLLDRGLIFQFAFKYTDAHRKELSEYVSFADFNKNFKITRPVFNDFIAYAEEKGVSKDKQGIRESESRIKILMKAFIGRNLYDDDGFYPVYHRIDETFLRAVEYL
ncbi:MAG: PDZ domain-containing protein, partial [Bacteroidales bacterium]|nr:PDZ domain-containing protein [Bacteroidales bacterium]